MVKMTFTLDDATVARLRHSAVRLAKPQSEIVREAIRDYADRVGRLSEQERLIRRLRDLFVAQGLFETVTSTLVAAASLAQCRLERSPVWPPAAVAAAPLPLRNPLSDEFDTLRPSILPGLLAVTQHNLRRGLADIFLFETGYAHSSAGEPVDRLLSAGVLLGSRWSGVWNADPALATDFYAAKGVIEAVAQALGLSPLGFTAADHPAFHPGRSAWFADGDVRLGIVGEIHPEVATALDLPRGLFAFEFDAAAVLERTGAVHRYEPSSRFPRALRDLAVVVSRDVPAAAIERILREAMGEQGRSVRLFDVYTGKPLPEDRVSLAFALELGADDRTLTDAEVDPRLDAARERLRTELGAEFRV